MPPRLFITPGEPAGIGPDILIHLAQQPWEAELIAVADPDLLQERAQQLALPLHLSSIDLAKPALTHQPSFLKIQPISLQVPVKPGHLEVKNAEYVMQTLKWAAQQCLDDPSQRLLTGPVQKSLLNEAGIAFSGHTEFFAEYTGVRQTVMLFVVNSQLKVALATTHLALADVPAAITSQKLHHTLEVLIEGLKQHFHLAKPRLLVCGLNPHAGEQGYLGREEIEIISPLLDQWRERGYAIRGPLPADTLFTPSYLEKADVVLAMYHDQALPVVKALGFGQAVNLTLGLPFMRVSVDHGTALDLAGTGKADPSSMLAAAKIALQLHHPTKRNSPNNAHL